MGLHPRPTRVTRAVLLSLLACIAMAATSAPSALAAGWEPGIIIATNGNAFAQPPQLLFDDSGRGAVVYGAGSGVHAVVRGADGTFGASTPLGTATDVDRGMDAGIAPGTGRVVVAWAQGTTIRTAVKDPGGAWVIPAPGDAGTYTAAIAPADVAVGVNADGRAVVVWEEGTPSGTVKLARLEASGWIAAPETFTGVDAFFRGEAGRDDDGNVVLAYQRQVGNEQVVYVARRNAAGNTSGPVPVSPTVSRFEGFALEPTARRVVVGFFHDAPGGETDTYRVWEGDTTNLSGAIRSTQAAVRPGIQSGSHGAVAAVEAGTGDGFATWMDNSPPSFANIGAATGFGPSWQALDLIVDVTHASSVAGARSGFGESFTVFTEIDPNFTPPDAYRVSSLRRSACGGGTWTTTRDVLSRGQNLGAVSAGASANGEAFASAVTTGSQVLLFRYTPTTEKPQCSAPAAPPVSNVSPGVAGAGPPLVVCGGTGTIVPPCFGQIPRPDPIITCGPAFGTILRSCEGLGLGIGGAPLGLGGEVPVQVSCGDVASLRFAGLARAIQSVAKACPINLKLATPQLGNIMNKALKGVGGTQRTKLFESLDDIFKTYEQTGAELTKATAATQNVVGALTVPEVPAPLDGALGELVDAAGDLQRAEQTLATSVFADLARRQAAGVTAERANRGMFGGISGAIGSITRTVLRDGGVISPALSQALTQLTTLNQQSISQMRIFTTLNRTAVQSGQGDTRVRTRGSATAAAASSAAARRLGRRLPLAGKAVVVPNGTRRVVKLKIAPWARPWLRRGAGRRVTVVASARSVRGGATRTSVRTVKLRVAKRKGK